MSRLVSSLTSLSKVWSSLPRMGSVRTMASLDPPPPKTTVSYMPPLSSRVYTKDELHNFMTLFPDIVRDLTYLDCYANVPSVNLNLSKCIHYNVPNGKKNRGLSVPISYKIIAPPEDQTEENIKLANILGWCVEFMEAYFLIADDIMDGSEIRRGQKAWYKKDNLGVEAFNDSLLLQSCIYTLLHKYFVDKPYYNELVQEFQEVSRHTSIGQSLDMLTARMRTPDGRVDIDAFDMKRYNAIALYKTAYYTIYLPTALAMRMANVTRPEYFRQAQTILLEIGRFFQIQDDYLDCFGDPEVTGKLGTDIQDGKCSWLIVVAMQRASKAQKETLREHYGRQDEHSVAAVKGIYDELRLQKIYKAYEEESHHDIIQHIRQIPGEGKLIPPKLFSTFINRLFKRDQ